MGFTEFIDFGVHPTSPPPPPAEVNYIIMRTGNFTQAKAGLNDNWTTEYTNASDMQAAGTRMAFRDASSGHIWAKDTLSGTWYDEGTADQYVVTSSYILERTGSTLYGKAGLNDSWTTLYSSATDVKAAGTRIAIIDTLGNLMAKDTLSGTWYTESSPTVNQYAVTPNYLLVRIGNTLYGKAGLNNSWTTLTSIASDVQADETRILIKSTSGEIYVKDTLNGTWNDESAPVDQYAVTADYVLIRSGNILYGKTGLNDSWTTLYSWATDVEASGQRIAIIDTLGNLMAKDTLTGPWYTESDPTIDQYAVTTTF
jgi:phage terminase large subunit-like protein